MYRMSNANEQRGIDMNSIEIFVVANGYVLRESAAYETKVTVASNESYVFESMENLKAFLDDNLNIPKAKETR